MCTSNLTKHLGDATIARFIKRARISMQRVRDHKPKSVEERLPVIKEWLLRQDNFFRHRGLGKRVLDQDSYCCDEFSIVIQPKTSKSYNRKGAEANQVREKNSFKDQLL